MYNSITHKTESNKSKNTIHKSIVPVMRHCYLRNGAESAVKESRELFYGKNNSSALLLVLLSCCNYASIFSLIPPDACHCNMGFRKFTYFFYFINIFIFWGHRKKSNRVLIIYNLCYPFHYFTVFDNIVNQLSCHTSLLHSFCRMFCILCPVYFNIGIFNICTQVGLNCLTTTIMPGIPPTP